MKLADALALTAAAGKGEGRPFSAYLACGFTPLHLKTFLHAHLCRQRPGRGVECETGPYGDLVLALEAQHFADADAVAAVIEWADLDPRLGYRALGGWRDAVLADMLNDVRGRLARLEDQIAATAARQPITVLLPTLPLPPLFHTAGWQASSGEIQLHHLVSGFSLTLAAMPGVTIVRSDFIDRRSPYPARADLKSELGADFPYTRAHADVVAEALARCLAPAVPAKGLITDLDDTLWSGLIGEIGVGGVAWGIGGNGHIHGLYQQMLNSLAETGVLLAVASKNDPEIARDGLAVPDLIIDRDALYPVVAGWGPKSEMVAEILRAWNVAPDAVVFVDDGPLEIAEVQARFPEMQCREFPTDDHNAALELFHELRQLFGKARISEDDRLRTQSIRDGAAFLAQSAGVAGSTDEFLAGVGAELQLEFAKYPLDPRPLELTNKTNQFNLNGERFDEREWGAMLARSSSFLAVASYSDKFGKLGKIGVAFGEERPGELLIEGWVLSCRAFSRRVEHAILAALFNRFGAEVARLNYRRTAKNGPLRQFIAPFAERMDGQPVTITRARFEADCPPLHHKLDSHG